MRRSLKSHNRTTVAGRMLAPECLRPLFYVLLSMAIVAVPSPLRNVLFPSAHSQEAAVASADDTGGISNADLDFYDLRGFLSKLVVASARTSDSEADKMKSVTEIRKVFAAYPHLILEILAARGAPELFAKSDIPIPSEKIRQGLEEMIPMLKKAYELEANLSDKHSMDFRDTRKNLGQWLLSRPEEQRLKLLSNLSDTMFLAVGDKVNENISSMKLSESPAVKMLIDPKLGFDLSNVPKQFSDFLKVLLSEYFDKLPLQDKRGMMVGLLGLPRGAKDTQKLGTFLQYSGPAVQKFFQLFGKNFKSPLIVAVMDQLKSNIRPFEMEKVRETIERNYGKKMEDIFEEFKEKPVAAASVGQVHFATLKDNSGKVGGGNKKEVVVKIMRPGLQERAERELDLMESLAPDEGTKKIVRSLREALMDEMDFRTEAKSLEQGEFYRVKKKGLYAVKEIKDLPAQKEVFIMEKAEGKSLDKFHEKRDLLKKLQGLEELLTLWLTEALFGSGTFHADLHSGNLFYQKKDTRPGYLLTLIDFGSMGHLSEEEKKAIINLGLGIAFKNPKTILESFTHFGPMSEETKKVFLEKITSALGNKEQGTGWKTNEILTKSIELGINFPKNIIQFNRGKMFLDNHIYETIQELLKMHPDKKFLRKYGDGFLSDYIAMDVVKNGLKPDLKKYFFSLCKGRGLVNQATIRRLIRESLGKVLKEYIRTYIFPPKIRRPCTTPGGAAQGPTESKSVLWRPATGYSQAHAFMMA